MTNQTATAFAELDAHNPEQHDLRPPRVLLSRVAVPHQSAEPIKVGRRNGTGKAGAHGANSHVASRPESLSGFTGIPIGIQMSDTIHYLAASRCVFSMPG